MVFSKGDIVKKLSAVSCCKAKYYWVSVTDPEKPENRVGKTRASRTEPHTVRRNVTMCVDLFDLTNKATWPKSLTFRAEVNCKAFLWIRGLPVSVVMVLVDDERVNIFIYWREHAKGLAYSISPPIDDDFIITQGTLSVSYAKDLQWMFNILPHSSIQFKFLAYSSMYTQHF